MIRRREVKGGEDAAVYRDQVRGELDGYRGAFCQRKFLFDFGKMPVFGHAVGADAFVAFDKEKILLKFATGTADAAERVSDNASRFDESCSQQGNGRKQNAGWITTGRSD